LIGSRIEFLPRFWSERLRALARLAEIFFGAALLIVLHRNDEGSRLGVLIQFLAPGSSGPHRVSRKNSHGKQEECRTPEWRIVNCPDNSARKYCAPRKNSACDGGAPFLEKQNRW
jgi:hypothetical protein